MTVVPPPTRKPRSTGGILRSIRLLIIFDSGLLLRSGSRQPALRARRGGRRPFFSRLASKVGAVSVVLLEVAEVRSGSAQLVPGHAWTVAAREDAGLVRVCRGFSHLLNLLIAHQVKVFGRASSCPASGMLRSASQRSCPTRESSSPMPRLRQSRGRSRPPAASTAPSHRSRLPGRR
jgi:hypothetical protein